MYAEPHFVRRPRQALSNDPSRANVGLIEAENRQSQICSCDSFSIFPNLLVDLSKCLSEIMQGWEENFQVVDEMVNVYCGPHSTLVHSRFQSDRL